VASSHTREPRKDLTRFGPAGLSAVLVLCSVAVWVAVRPGSVPIDPQPLWVLGLIFVAFLVAESTLMHIEFRKQGNAISLSEIPLVIGLFVLGPVELVGVRVLAVAAVLAWQRRSPVKSIFNLALIATEVVVAEAIFTAFGTADVGDSLSWLSALVACPPASSPSSASRSPSG
jgi:hypothetical protein